MLRKLAIAIAASGAMMSASTTYALGMGDIVLDSALNQPLDARIKLLKASELEDWEIKPDLASREEFEKSGVERVFFLNSFKFEIERTESGVYVNLSSDQPVVEPFLNFLVQVDWPSGRLLREYTLLLDPPVFAEDEPSRVSAPSEQNDYDSEIEDDSGEMLGDSEEELEATDLPGSGVYEEESESDVESVSPEKPKAKSKTYAVRKNDTLWEVAIKTRSNRKISPQQAMLAIQDLNPSAFINGNINRLKKNQVLRVPTSDEMLSRSFSEAVSEVAMQNQAIAKRKAQLDATRKDEAMTRDDEVSGSRLKLLAGGDATTGVKRGASGNVLEKAAGDQSNLENDLNLALENLDKSTLENQELRTRLDSLEDQINTLQRLINLKDEQMVALQAGVSSTDVKEAKVDADMADDLEAPLEQEIAATGGDLNFNSAEEKPAEAKLIDPVKAEGDEDLASDAVAEKAGEPKVKPKPKAKFVYTPPEDEPFDIVAFAIENPQIPGAVIGALLLALLAVSRARKRKEEVQENIAENHLDIQDPLDEVASDLEDDFHSEFDDLQLGEEADSTSDFDSAGFDSSELDDFDQADAGLPDSLDDADLGEGQDVLGEVDVYMAYNRIEPAKELLEKTLQQQPGRNELRVKLLEVLAEVDDQAAFSEHFDYLMVNADDSEKAQAEAIKSRFAGAATADLSDDLGMGLDVSSDSAGLNLDEGELDFDLDGLDLSSDLDAPTDAAAELSHDSTLDFDMDLSDFDTDSIEVSGQAEELELDGAEQDAGLDFASSLDTLDISDDSVSMDLGSDDSLELGSLDADNSLDLGADLDVTMDSTELESLDLDESLDSLTLDDSGSLDVDDGLSFESSDLTDLETPELDSDSLSMDGADLDLGLDVDLEIPSLDDELSLDSMEDDLAELSGSMDLDDDLDLGSLESELDSGDIELDESLESLDLEQSLDVPSLDEPEELAEVSDISDDLVELGSLDAPDELPPLGDLDLDNLDEDLDFLSGTDESETKLDLARAYIDMDDKDGAKEILQEVLEEGTDQQKEDASKLMDSMA